MFNLWFPLLAKAAVNKNDHISNSTASVGGELQVIDHEAGSTVPEVLPLSLAQSTPAKRRSPKQKKLAELPNLPVTPAIKQSVILVGESTSRPKRKKRTKPMTMVQSAEMVADSNLATPAPADAEAAPPTESPASTSAAVEKSPVVVPKPLFAISIETGIFALVAAQAEIEAIKTFARFELEPLPRTGSAPGAYFKSHRTESGNTLYIAYIPWPSVAAGPVQIACTTASDQKQVMMINCLPYQTIKPEALLSLIKRFGRLLLPALDAVLSAEHPLRKALLKPAKVVAQKKMHPTVQGCFDGIIDGLAHGWVYDPAQSDKTFTVELVHEGEVVACGLANRYRDDLHANGIGDGCHHFRLLPSYELFDGREHLLTVNVVELGQPLPSAAVRVLFAAQQPRHFDWMTRSQTLREALQLGRSANVHNHRAEQALLQAVRKACLQQETWLLEDARAAYQRLADILGVNHLCYTKIAETWLLDNKLEPALEAYSAAVEIRPDYHWAHLGIGNVLQLQGKPLDAEAAYHRALGFDPNSVVIKRRLAAVRSDALAARAAQLQNSGDNAGAIDLLKTVILDQPDNETACDSLDVLLRTVSAAKHGNYTRLPSYIKNATKACRLLDVVLDEVEKRLSTMTANQVLK